MVVKFATIKRMKLLNGDEIASYIKPRQAQQVRALRQASHVFPKLAIIQTQDDPVINTYIKLKKAYGEDILVEVAVHKIAQADALNLISELNNDPTVHGVIVQLPLPNIDQTDEIVNALVSEKDVDALGVNAMYDAATPTAINWLLAGYNINLREKNIAIIGEGKLVGLPLYKMWQASGYKVAVLVEGDDLAKGLREAEVIISATGQAGILKSEIVPTDAIIVDAGTTSEKGKLVGDFAKDVYERSDLTLTPRWGGVGPLTVAALFENVIRAARL